MAPETAVSLTIGTRLGSYEILEPIGEGGMGEVYRARDARLGRNVAIKTITPRLATDPKVLARFQREARVIASLSHPNVLAIHDVGSQDGIWFLVTELLEGETLRDRIAKGPLSRRTAIEFAASVAQGLAAAHARGIVHRDLKPANIFLLSDGRVKVLDFGLARQTETATATDDTQSQPLTDATAAGVVMGTVGYMSPEQVRGLPVDARSDIFSLGCVLYEMLAGRRPFQLPTPVETFAAILNADPAPLAGAGGSVPADLERIVRHCLEKDRNARFQSAQDLAFALGTAASPAEAVPARRPEASVAVLPFLNLSADPENEFFTDGMTEDIIAHLSKVRSLKVISRASVMVFKKRDRSLQEVARTLGAAAILDGSVRRAGQRVRIVAQLIDPTDDRHLWVETYDRDLTDIFAIQTDVALQIAAALRAELSADERTRIHKPPTYSLQAYQLYLQGRHCSNRYTAEGWGEAIRYFEQAIAADPTLALAYVGLARVYAEGTTDGTLSVKPEVGFARAKEAIDRALALDSGLGEAHGIVALLKFVCDFDWPGAEREFEIALSLSPGSADIYDHYGWMCSSVGRYDDALRFFERARELDPLAHPTDGPGTLLRAGRNQEALEQATRVVEFDPTSAKALAICGWAYIRTGRMAEGLALLERAVEVAGGDTLTRAQLGHAYGIAGRPADARAILKELQTLARERYVPPYHLAYVHAGLDDRERAIDCLERAFAEKAGAIYGIKGTFFFRSLHSHPRFVALLRKMNLA